MTESDCSTLCFSSLYWLSGFGTLINGTLNECVRIITTEVFSAELALKLIPKYKVRTTVGPPANLAMIIQHAAIEKTDLSSLTHYWCGGSVVHDELIIKMNKYLTNGRVYVAYGMTEGNTAITSSISEQLLGSVGQVGDCVQVKIVDDDGNKCGINVDGEICFHAKNLFLGYYGNEAETKSVFDRDGFMHTGDVGHFNENGFLFLVDRKKDILKYRNSQISPSEIESVIQKLDGVELVCVVGIPDLVCTDLPAAAILKSATGNITEAEVNSIVKGM